MLIGATSTTTTTSTTGSTRTAGGGGVVGAAGGLNTIQPLQQPSWKVCEKLIQMYPKTSIPETEKLIVTVGLERAKQYLQQKYGQQMKNTSSGTTTTTTTTSSSLRMNKEEEIVPNKCAQNTISGQNNSGSTTFSTFNGIFTFFTFFHFFNRFCYQLCIQVE